MTLSLDRLAVVTLFVEDLEAAKSFYLDVFGVPVVFEDDASAVFRFGSTLVNLLKTEAAQELIEPAAVGRPDAGSRFQLTIEVDDVDAMCTELAEARRGASQRGPWIGPGACEPRPSGIPAATSGRSRSSSRREGLHN